MPSECPRSSSVAATSTARSSDPSTSRRAIAGRPTGSAPGPRSAIASRMRAPSAAASGTIRVTSPAVIAERRASGRSAAQDAVGVDAGRVDREGEHDRDDAQADRRSGSERLQCHVGVPDHGHVPAPDQDRVAPVRDQDVDQDHEDQQRDGKPERGPDGPAGTRGDARESGGRRRRDQHQRARVDESDDRQGAEIGDHRPGIAAMKRAAPGCIGKWGSHCTGTPIAPAPGWVATA